jgi:hypothetical protein
LLYICKDIVIKRCKTLPLHSNYTQDYETQFIIPKLRPPPRSVLGSGGFGCIFCPALVYFAREQGFLCVCWICFATIYERLNEPVEGLNEPVEGLNG